MVSTDRIASACGFDASNIDQRAYFAPAAALALALGALPLLLVLLVDVDRSLPLAFLPAVWLARKLPRTASTIDACLLGWAIVAMIVAAAWAPHAARALVMTAAVGWTFAGAEVARRLASSTSAIRLVLAGIVTGAVAGVIMVLLGVGAGQIFFPVYWSARLFGAHEFVGCLSVLPLLLVPSANRYLRLLTITAALIIWTGFAWSGSRAPAIGLAATIMLWFWRGSPSERRFLAQWVPALSLAGLALSYPLGNPYPQLGWWDAFARTAEATGVESVTSERSLFWMATLRHAVTSAWIGHGADSYLYIHPAQNGNQPHNVLLQWFLEYGAIGALPLVLLLLRGMRGLVRAGESSVLAQRPLMIWTSAALVGSFIYGLFEGVFYHMIVFMPVAIFTGFALGQYQVVRCPSTFRLHRLSAPLLVGALAVLALHNWLGFTLLRAENLPPNSAPARILRIFPSTTYGLRHWIDHWRSTQPDVAMEWITWAQEAAIDQGAYHVQAAQLYLWEKDYASAEAELMLCLEKVHHGERSHVLEVLGGVRRRLAEQKSKEKLGDSSQPHPNPQ